ncbi:MAG: NYN domain-containing protein [Chlamydiota bacterium]
MHYVIDGYNLLFRLPITKKGFASKREVLITLLRGAKITSADLIFDGQNRKEMEAEFVYFGSISVVFTSKGQTADQYILSRVSLHANETIVTSDKKLSSLLTSEGFRVISCEEFIQRLVKKERKSSSTSSDFQDTKANIERLEKLFEKRLLDEESKKSHREIF